MTKPSISIFDALKLMFESQSSTSSKKVCTINFNNSAKAKGEIHFCHLYSSMHSLPEKILDFSPLRSTPPSATPFVVAVRDTVDYHFSLMKKFVTRAMIWILRYRRVVEDILEVYFFS